MGKVFEFNSGGVELDFGHVQFDVDPSDPDLIERILEFSDGAIAMADKLEGSGDYLEDIRKIISFSLSAIDSILGEGASDKIFEGQKVTMFNALDVINYINAEVKRGKDEKYDKYLPERVQR